MRVIGKTLLLATTMLLACSTASDPGKDLVSSGDIRESPDSAAPLDLATQTDETVEDGVPADYLIVAADDLWETAAAFAAYRESTGYTVEATRLTDLLTSPDMADNLMVDELSAWVRTKYTARDKDRPFYLLIIGDAVEAGTDPSLQVPVGYWPGGWQDCFGDNAYADMDYDYVPDLAVGRIPVADNETGLEVLSRIKSHEQDYEVGPWNSRLNVYAGEGGFGEDIDFFIETVAQKGLESVPYEYSIRFAYNSPSSNYYYTPFKEKVLEMVASGALLVTFMGHGGGELNVPDLAAVVPEHRQPMYAWFACSTGDYASSWESDAEEVFKQAGGPMAALVSTATTHPYANAINALEIEAAIFEERPETYGEAIRLMKWRTRYHTSELREIIDEFAKMNMPESEMLETVNDHMFSYNLLGDPAVQIRFPMGSVELEAANCHSGDELAFSGSVSNIGAGTASLELVCPRATVLKSLTPVDNPSDPASAATVQANWAAANDKVVATTDVAIVDGQLSGTLAIPNGTPAGTYFLTVYAIDDGKSVDAVGSVELKVTKP